MLNEVILHRHSDAVCELTIDRPSARNALGWDAWRQLDAAIALLRNDEDLKVLLISGGDSVFSAGGDLKSSGVAGSGILAPAARLELAHRVITDIFRFPRPTIAVVEGGALGVAWSLVLACDLVVASTGAFFSAPHVLRGYAPDGGLAWFLTRAVGRQRALDILLFAETLSGEAAHDLGLVTHFVDTGTAHEAAVSLAARLIAMSPDALRLARGSVRQAMEVPLGAFLEDEVVRVALALDGPDAREGRKAFAERRVPHFAEDPQ
jgi:2-(1,2-epoxy-1,2-dihydrophenyl)acetyl-CoA isomerase